MRYFIIYLISDTQFDTMAITRDSWALLVECHVEYGLVAPLGLISYCNPQCVVTGRDTADAVSTSHLR